jgi:hypothetical protein
MTQIVVEFIIDLPDVTEADINIDGDVWFPHASDFHRIRVPRKYIDAMLVPEAMEFTFVDFVGNDEQGEAQDVDEVIKAAGFNPRPEATFEDKLKELTDKMSKVPTADPVAQATTTPTCGDCGSTFGGVLDDGTWQCLDCYGETASDDTEDEDVPEGITLPVQTFDEFKQTWQASEEVMKRLPINGPALDEAARRIEDADLDGIDPELQGLLGAPSAPVITLLSSDYFNAHYVDGILVRDAKPDYLDVETLARTFPDAAVYDVPEDVYDEYLNGNGYPQQLSSFPLARCRKCR